MFIKKNIILLVLFSINCLVYSNNNTIFASWIERTCKPFDKGKLTAFPRFNIVSKNLNMSAMLRFEDLPEVNSERWLSPENFEGEKWKDLQNASGYQVSNYGRVRSVDRIVVRSDGQKRHYIGKVLRPNTGTNGYLYFNVRNVGTLYIHRCVALNFVPNDDKSLEVDHIDSIKTDNRASNLRWITHFENASRGSRGKKHDNTMEKNPKAKSVIGVSNGKIVEEFKCAKMVSIKYGVNYSSLKRHLQNGGTLINNIYYKYGNKTT